jgi:hypothetical protein
MTFPIPDPAARAEMARVWDAALAEWGDGPRTMKATADWANRWIHHLRTASERDSIDLSGLRLRLAQSETAVRELREALEAVAPMLSAYFDGERIDLAFDAIPERILVPIMDGSLLARTQPAKETTRDEVIEEVAGVVEHELIVLREVMTLQLGVAFTAESIEKVLAAIRALGKETR